MYINKKVLFFGSGDFPIDTLEYLISSGVNIVGVITSNDKVKYHNYKLSDVAKRNNIPLLVPKDVNDDESYEWIKNIKADIFCVISYKFLKKRIYSLANITSFNVHASMLPLLKGAAPIQWAIRYGFKETGLTSFVLDEGLDTGKTIMIKKCEISNLDTYETLYHKLANMSKDFTLKTIERICLENFNELLNDQANIGVYNYLLNAPKINKNNSSCPIAPNNSIQVYDTIRSLSPNYGFFATIEIINKDSKKIVDTVDVKIISASLSNDVPKKPIIDKIYYSKHEHKFPLTNIVTDGKTYMAISFTDNSFIYIDSIQKEGKKIMTIKEFLCGFRNGRETNKAINIYTKQNFRDE